MAKAIAMQVLEQARALAQQFRRVAEETDASRRPPRSHLEAMAEAGIFRHGAEAPPGERRRVLDLLASGCGVTSFLSTQHAGACRRLRAAGHPLLEDAIHGRVWVGVCFAHLRRARSPVTVEAAEGGYRFSGKGPWFSGWGLMDHVLVGGALPDGKFLLCLTRVDRPEILIGAQPEFAVMNASATVPLTFEDLWLPQDSVIVQSDAQTMNQADMHSTAYQAARSLGVTRAAAEYLPEALAEQVLKAIEEHHQRLDRWDTSPSWPTAVAFRHQAIELGRRSCQAALMAVGGRGHASAHPVQRLCREASFYATTQLTAELREATLEHLQDFLRGPSAVSSN